MFFNCKKNKSGLRAIISRVILQFRRDTENYRAPAVTCNDLLFSRHGALSKLYSYALIQIIK
ncbi:2105_t:CDS:2 [Funneliformis mosseae]|uniref:2105_t:CDS:1 n=1 Tax=Funneliformis mosseae TaxID=27381 RepID=A0A9N9B4X2_FUNMO|nr:2105_t:CDS:2 [Funneliformis mosseae]